MKIDKPVITICSSSAFYRQAVKVQDQINALGYKVIVPIMATRMKESGDFEVSHYKTWYADANDYDKKAELMRGHFAEVEKGDAILVLNYEKNSKQNYIGGNVLMEMALAFWRGKPIFILNEVPEDSAYVEEIRGMLPVIMHGDINAIDGYYRNAHNG